MIIRQKHLDPDFIFLEAYCADKIVGRIWPIFEDQILVESAIGRRKKIICDDMYKAINYLGRQAHNYLKIIKNTGN